MAWTDEVEDEDEEDGKTETEGEDDAAVPSDFCVLAEDVA